MPTDDTAKLGPACAKCGGATEPLNFIPRFGDQPAYRIFECVGCKALTWIAEVIKE